ncbi:hypothetical protein BCR43DRAFT_522988 [Syncephalastrum racemosum]|uniref:Uncharacterized protein n=1 Tax=Syncephalastrum racemosum TaxID=13706 RepID=A0A1X2HK32_SYNRA|nr:hypothetical protein BCR43DRAFT_522988 [Syncephalastrum racemosum]
MKLYNYMERIEGWFAHIPARVYALLAETMLVLMGGALMGIDLGYVPGKLKESDSSEVYRTRFGDFYLYLALGGLISVWSIFGLAVTLMRNERGVRLYLWGLSALGVTQIIVGVIHIVLLFSLYRPALLDTCLDQHPNQHFWWSLGYQQSSEDQQIYQECSSKWRNFVLERTFTWAVYSVLVVAMSVLVRRYKKQLKKAHTRQVDAATMDAEEWMDEKPITTRHHRRQHRRRPPSFNEAPEPPPPAYHEIPEMREQRDKLYAEIAKRREAQKQRSGNRRSTVLPDSGEKDKTEEHKAVHPLDLTQPAMAAATAGVAPEQKHERQEQEEKQDEEEYEPPPPRPTSQQEVTDGVVDAPVSGVRHDPMSSEKIEYDSYRAKRDQQREHRFDNRHDSSDSFSEASSGGSDDEGESTDDGRRDRLMSVMSHRRQTKPATWNKLASVEQTSAMGGEADEERRPMLS